MKFEKWLYDRGLLYPLINFNESFCSILDIGRVVSCKDIPYAGITCRNDTIEFLVNEENFDVLDQNKQLFIIMHEILHIVYEHLARIGDLPNKMKANLAADCVVNGDLIHYFEFSKDEIDPKNIYVWPDTFKLPYGLSMESYYSLIPDDACQGQQTIDSHEAWKSLPENIKEKIIEIGKELEKAKNLHDNAPAPSNIAGTHESVGNFIVEKVNFPIPRIDWRSVIKFLTKSCIAATDADRIRWDRKNRRYTNFNGDTYLPTEVETETYTISKSLAYIYMDISGSCINDKDYIYAIMRQIPHEFFVTKVFTFDTRVTTPKKLDNGRYEIIGGGGTCFRCINNHVNEQEIKPDIVFVITDGEGTSVSPDEPEKWTWILTSNYSYHIPPASKQIFVKKVK